ncbi:MAG: sulfotransferase [Longimonas sp.]|uniref:sulfotransferase n=1 Tax=Longimonas sp. TaxID=2039626 RepID=UPI003364458A
MMSSLSSLRRRVQRLVHRVSPVWWANLGRISDLLARRLPMQSPPILVVAFPRSGSSWLGRLLAYADNACYLREPITQARRRWHPEAVHAVSDAGVQRAPRYYRQYADRAFAGCPAFSYATVRDPGDWALRRRHKRRVLIKEVNPFAVGWMRMRYAPTVIHLMRHPVAVALSMHRRGWTSQTLREYVHPGRLADSPLNPSSVPTSFWGQIGAVQGLAHRAVKQACPEDAYTAVQYETLCIDPVATVQELCEWVGLRWDDAVTAAIQSHSADSSRNAPDPYSTTRQSTARATAWKAASPERIDAVRAGYMAAEPTVYTSCWGE